ncbi:MAG: histidine phosphatase family protein [Anaerolineales bacterium]|nr:histidine phosphatase family protein [Anaerolineales bacterium]
MSKTLLIMRHAKSSWKDDALDDHARPLNKRGRRDAPVMGARLREQGLTPDAILSSTALRARETAEAVAEASGFAGEVSYHAGFYDDAPEAYLAALARLPEAVQVALLVAHNPGCEELLAELTGEEEVFATAAIAQVTLHLARWAELSLSTEGGLKNMWRPREDD